MSPVMIGILLIIIFFVLVFLAMPLSFGMIFIGLIGTALITSFPTAFEMVASEMYAQFSRFNLLVVPMYVWMGYIAYESGIGAKLYNLAYKWVGHIRGGLAIATEVSSALFGAICGSAPATAAIMGTISLPEMKKYNYDMKLATASIASGGILGVLIPPSVIIMIYGVATQTSIQKLFKASVVPGLLLLLLYAIVIYILTYRDPSLAPAGEKSSWKERFNALKGGLWEVIIVFGLSLGGLFAGWFTPSEAGSVGAAGILLVTVIEGSLSWEGFKNSLHDTIRFTSMLLLIFAGATIFGRFLAITTLPIKLSMWIGSLTIPNILIMLMILFVYLVLGCFVDIPALVLITVPVMYPIVVDTLGYNPVWFGVIILMVQGMGIISPPVGVNVYIIHDVAKNVGCPIKLGEIFRGIWPFLAAIFVCSVILLLFPQIVTFVL